MGLKINEKNYCVYKHKNTVNKKVYIGMTGNQPEKRWANGNGYKGCPYFWKAIQKYGWNSFEHIILENNLTKEQAEEKEIFYIEKYNSTNHDCGYNIQKGGSLNGSKTVYQYDRFTGEFIKKWDTILSVEFELGIPNADISAVCLGKIKTVHNYYFSFNDLGDTLPNDIFEWINTNEGYTPVAQYNLDGEFITIYDTQIEAIKTLFGEDTEKRLNFKNHISYGYIWKKVINKSIDYTASLSKRELHAIYLSLHANSKECYRYDLHGNYIESYSSTTKAAKEINGSQSAIAYACRNHSVSYDSYWRYAEEVEDKSNLCKETFHIHKLSKKIYKYDLSGNYIQCYNSVKEAATSNHTYTTNISGVCSGKIKTLGGYIYRYELMSFDEEELSYINNNDRCRKVAQYDINMNLIKEYDSVISAEKETGIRTSGISLCCNGKQKYTIDKKDKTIKYIWKYI